MKLPWYQWPLGDGDAALELRKGEKGGVDLVFSSIQHGDQVLSKHQTAAGADKKATEVMTKLQKLKA